MIRRVLGVKSVARMVTPNVELIQGGVGSSNSNRSVTRRWMEHLVVRPLWGRHYRDHQHDSGTLERPQLNLRKPQ